MLMLQMLANRYRPFAGMRRAGEWRSWVSLVAGRFSSRLGPAWSIAGGRSASIHGLGGYAVSVTRCPRFL